MKWPQTRQRDLRIKAALSAQCREKLFQDITDKYILDTGRNEVLKVGWTE